MRDGRRFGAPPKPYRPPEMPAGKINTTDPDARNVKTPRGYMQGYNAQAAVNERQIVVAAEINTDSPDFGHLEPMLDAARTELAAAGVTERPEVVVADAGYWHQAQMESIVSQGIPVLIPPDAGKRKGTRQAGTAAPTRSCVACSPPTWATRSTENARRPSSRCSPTPNSTAGSTASSAAADPPAAPSGD
jgi:hypothetical protein